MALTLLIPLTAHSMEAAQSKKGERDKTITEAETDRFADYVWPPPPDQARIKLESIFSSRADVEATSSFKKFLIGVSEKSQFDHLTKPHDVAIDHENRVLVTDTGLKALIRFDRAGQRMDVLGTTGGLRLNTPMAVTVAADGTVYVADSGLRKVLAFDEEGKIVAVFGREGELENPTDVAISPDGERVWVADSRAHRIAIFRRDNGQLEKQIGHSGDGPGEFSFPTSLAFDLEGNVLVVDQMNARLQILSPAGDFIDSYGQRGDNFGNFVRPKYVAVDEVGFIYVTDAAFNNVQIFDADLSLLTFVGSGGSRPGQFLGATGIDVRGDFFAIADQLNRRVQVFRFVVPKTAE